MLHDDYLCLVESGKQQIKEVRRKFKRKTWKQRQLLSESGFVLRIAPPSLSRDRRIKMKKSSINQIKKQTFENSTYLYQTSRTFIVSIIFECFEVTEVGPFQTTNVLHLEHLATNHTSKIRPRIPVHMSNFSWPKSHGLSAS